MNILLIGGGGREHALAWKLSQSPRLSKLYCAPGNAGIAALAERVPLKATDLDALVAFAQTHDIGLAVVAPDDPLALGLVDKLEAAGVPAFGPTGAAAQIESSKVFSKGLMAKYGIPTAAWQAFDDPVAAVAYVRAQGAPIVVKADGLALGKGVVVAQTVPEAEAAVRAMMEDKRFKEAGARVVIEDCMTGPEVTVLAFTDGKTVVPMLSSRDHKRALDGDQGPNTGGMGAICPAPGYTPELAQVCMETIFGPTIRAMTAEGRPFKGVLYFGLMLTPDGPKVVEYNARFGDPEAQALLMLLDSDLLELMLAIREERLAAADVRWRSGASCCVVLASGGYPESYQTGYPITGLPADTETLTVFHAGTALSDSGQLVTNGGRVLGVTARADTLDEAIDRAYAAAEPIAFTGRRLRRDIGRTHP
ncbi:MAG: phosphoribosylamine--glycine ligase [Oscillospiraceae bacterium]|jgi:phosphoribosylamine--glycine ligase|nr:phosphoribosylamine--glycine ligase [Oscillospiraceae bacterium]